MGRPTKLTPEARDRFLQAIRAGVFPETASRLAGFSPASYYRYAKGTTPDQVEFRDAVQEALATLETRLTGTIVQAAMADPRWALAMLERRFPERWRVRDRTAMDVEAAEPGPPTETPIRLDPELVDVLVPKLLAAGRRPDDETHDEETLALFASRGTSDRVES